MTHAAVPEARCKKREASSASSRGFTLVEVMVTMAITVILFAMIGTILTSFLTTQKKVEGTLLRERVGSAILEVFAKDLEGAYIYDIDGAVKGVDERGGGGDADRIEFVTTRDPAVREADDEEESASTQRAGAYSDGGTSEETVPRDPPRLSKVIYSTRDSSRYPGLLTLFRSEALFVPPPPGTSASSLQNQGALAQAAAVVGQSEPVERFMEVYDRVRSINFRYLRVDRSQSTTQGGAPPPGEWRDQWDDPQDTPVAVELTLEIVADPTRDTGEGQDRARKIYKTIVAIPVTKAPPATSTGTSTGAVR